MEPSSELSFRRATLQDREGVLQVGKNIYNGIDYLAHYYDRYAEDSRRQCFVAELDGVIVGFAIGFVVDRGTRCIVQASRVTESLRGHNIYTRLLQHLKHQVATSNPRMTEITFTTWSHNPATKKASFWEVYQEVLRRFYFLRSFDTAQLATALPSVQHLVQPDTTESVTEPMLAHLLVSPEREQLFPGSRIVRNWEPFEVLDDNASSIMHDTSTVFASKEGDHVVAVSLSSLMRVTVGPRLDIDVYGTHVDTIISHIVLTLQSLSQQGHLTSENHQILISVDRRVDAAPIDAVLDQMGFKEGVLPSSDQYTLVAPFESQSE